MKNMEGIKARPHFFLFLSYTSDELPYISSADYICKQIWIQTGRHSDGILERLLFKKVDLNYQQTTR